MCIYIYIEREIHTYSDELSETTADLLLVQYSFEYGLFSNSLVVYGLLYLMLLQCIQAH